MWNAVVSMCIALYWWRRKLPLRSANPAVYTLGLAPPAMRSQSSPVEPWKCPVTSHTNLVLWLGMTAVDCSRLQSIAADCKLAQQYDTHDIMSV
jgi:hypothetical protein